MAFWNSIFCSESYPISIIICHLEITRPQRKSPRVFLTVLFSFSEVVSLLFPLYVIIMSRTSFKVNLHSIVCLNLKELLARSRRHIWSLSDSKSNAPCRQLFITQLNHLRPVWLNGWVFVYQLSGCGLESRCFYLFIIIIFGWR